MGQVDPCCGTAVSGSVQRTSITWALGQGLFSPDVPSERHQLPSLTAPAPCKGQSTKSAGWQTWWRGFGGKHMARSGQPSRTPGALTSAEQALSPLPGLTMTPVGSPRTSAASGLKVPTAYWLANACKKHANTWLLHE